MGILYSHITIYGYIIWSHHHIWDHGPAQPLHNATLYDLHGLALACGLHGAPQHLKDALLDRRVSLLEQITIYGYGIWSHHHIWVYSMIASPCMGRQHLKDALLDRRVSLLEQLQELDD